MDKVHPRSDLEAARKSINNALKDLYMSRVLLNNHLPEWPPKLRRLESELFALLGEIEFEETGCRVSSWWTRR